jgi:hypothetical protein
LLGLASRRPELWRRLLDGTWQPRRVRLVGFGGPDRDGCGLGGGWKFFESYFPVAPENSEAMGSILEQKSQMLVVGFLLHKSDAWSRVSCGIFVLSP